MLLQMPHFTFNCQKCLKIFSQNMMFEPKGSRFDRVTWPYAGRYRSYKLCCQKAIAKIIIRLSRCFTRAQYFFWQSLKSNPGSLNPYAHDDMSAKLYYIGSCTFHDTFKVKCPLIGATNTFSFIWNR